MSNIEDAQDNLKNVLIKLENIVEQTKSELKSKNEKILDLESINKLILNENIELKDKLSALIKIKNNTSTSSVKSDKSVAYDKNNEENTSSIISSNSGKAVGMSISELKSFIGN